MHLNHKHLKRQVDEWRVKERRNQGLKLQKGKEEDERKKAEGIQR